MTTTVMTYDELAARLRIGRKSAQNLARRKAWARSKGNDGRARIEVPDDELPMDPPMAPSVDEPVAPPEDPRVALLEVQIEGLKELVAAEKARADAAEADRDRWHAQATTSLWKRLVG